MELAKKLVPYIQDAVKKGDVTVEKQQEVLNAYNALKENLDAAFSGPQWEVEPDPS